MDPRLREDDGGVRLPQLEYEIRNDGDRKKYLTGSLF